MKNSQIAKHLCRKIVFLLGILGNLTCNAKVTTIAVDHYLNEGTDTKAIFHAFELAKTINDSVIVSFSNRKYVINPSEIYLAKQLDDIFLFEIRSNMQIIGGPETEIFLESGWVNEVEGKLANFMVWGSREFITNFSMNSLIIDFNGAVNRLTLQKGKRLTNSILYIHKGRNIKISGVKVLNNPGGQSITIAGVDKNGKYLISDVVIENCVFNTNTDAFPKNIAKDHSSIYVAGSGVKILNNELISGEHLSAISTAIETHVSNSMVSNNTIRNYSTGINVVALDGDQMHSTYSDNVMDNVEHGFVFWASNGKIMNDIILQNNKITQATTNASIISMAHVTPNSLISDIYIVGNTLRGSNEINSTPEAKMAGALSRKVNTGGNCIEIGPIKSIVIKGNIIKDIKGRAITMVGKNLNIDSLVILNNQFFNINKSQNAKYSHVVGLKALGNIQHLIIQENHVDRKTNFYITNGLKVQRESIKDNHFND